MYTRLVTISGTPSKPKATPSTPYTIIVIGNAIKQPTTPKVIINFRVKSNPRIEVNTDSILLTILFFIISNFT